jgi:hypothetical protein
LEGMPPPTLFSFTSYIYDFFLTAMHTSAQSSSFLVPLPPPPLPFQCRSEYVIIFREYLVFRLEPNQLREGGAFWKRPMEVRDTDDGHSESASLDLSLSFRWVVGQRYRRRTQRERQPRPLTQFQVGCRLRDAEDG